MTTVLTDEYGLQREYTEVKRKSAVGERIKIVEPGLTFGDYSVGDVFTVNRVEFLGVGTTTKCEGWPDGIFIGHDEYVVIEPLDTAPTASAQPDVLGLIANLASRITELERRVCENTAQPEKEVPDVSVNKPLIRGGIIDLAKRDVEALSKKHWNESGDVVYSDGHYLYSAEFIVNREKRTVVCLLRRYKGEEVQYRGIAKCAPDDVFNSHIGRAIALRRALGLEVPEEYVDAPLPIGAQVGDVVRGKPAVGENNYYSEDKTFTLTKDFGDGSFGYAERPTDWIYTSDIGLIIDDSREGDVI